MSRSGLPDTTAPAAPTASPDVTFRPADPPRTGSLLLGGHPMALLDALGSLCGRDDAWGSATVLALQLVARGAITAEISPDGYDAWAPDLDPSDEALLSRLADDDPDRAALLHAFCDAVADTLPRSPDRRGAYAGLEPVRLAAAPASGASTSGTLRISLRIESADVPDGDRPELRAVLQCHVPARGADPEVAAEAAGSGTELLSDAVDLWGSPGPGFGPAHRVATVLALRRAAQAWPPLERLLSAAVPDALVLDDADLGDLLSSGAAALAGAGVAVYWPRGLRDGPTARIVAGRDSRDDGRDGSPGLFGADSAVELDWQLALGGEPLSVAEYEELARAASPMVRLRDEWVLVDPALARRAARRGTDRVPVARAVAAALAGELVVDGVAVPVTATGSLDRLRETLAAAPEALPEPPGLAAQLRDYQRQGLGWLARQCGPGGGEPGMGGCLADDMGLGKTITVIALHLHRRAVAESPTLVVCPASVLPNWEREIRRFAPGVPVVRFHGAGRSADVGDGGIVLTTYGTLRADPAPLAKRTWDLVVADEAQQIKNARSDTARALRTVPAAARVALSGTPVQNRLADLWAILDWTTPGLLGGPTEFARRWAEPVESGTDPAAADRLARLVGPFLLRRRKSDPGVAPELTARTVTDRAVGLTREQGGLYTAAVDAATTAVAGTGGIDRHRAVASLLTSLKQVCNHPAHYLGESGPDVVLEGRSGKLDAFDTLLDRILDAGERTLVFTQYVAMARLLEKHLARRGVPVALLHGGLTLPARSALVDRFQAGELPVLLASLTAAGTGLNLTRADHVVHYDRWWNPAVEDQATDRAHRIGRIHPVHVHRLVARGTLEERIAEMLERKRALSDSVLARGEDALTGLSDAQLAELVALTSDVTDAAEELR